MGNCLSDERFVRPFVDQKTGLVYEKLVCSRCHKEGHGFSDCKADRYYDGSSIRIFCNKCNKKHYVGDCNQDYCVIM